MTKSASVRTIKRSLSFVLLTGVLVFSFIIPAGFVAAQTDDHTFEAEAEGKKVWDALQAKEKTCADLNDDDFEFLGEYYMGQMAGESHAAMNQMMISMMGEDGEEQMHAVMGKRLSGCDTSAAYPTDGSGFLPMMGMMNMMGGGMMGGRYYGGDWSNFMNFSDTNNMMSYGFGPSFLFVGWIFAVLWHILIIVGIVVLIKWLWGKMGGASSSAVNILKERYAKGEITKHEFEERKKDLR